MPDIRIRDVPPDMHRALKAEAALRGITLEAYLLYIIGKRELLQKTSHKTFASHR